ncbi:MAG: CBS domain-containing protein [Betaproteobacteria bacterium]
MKPIVELLRKRDPVLYKVEPSVMVFDGLKLLSDHGIGAMLVMEGDTLAGVFSERDYTRKVALQGKNSRQTPISEIMTANVITVAPQTGTRICMALMSQHKIRHLPVVDNGKVLGMISIRDIMDDMIVDHEQTIAQLHTYITS